MKRLGEIPVVKRFVEFIGESTHAPFISDMGQSHTLKDPKSGKTRKLGRYGVWKHDGRKHQVVDTGDDLESLKKKHGVTTTVRIGGASQ